MLVQQLQELQLDEGFRLTVYDDATGAPIGPGSVVQGHPTIGYGRALDVRGLLPAEADYLFGNDVQEIETALGKLPWYMALDDIRQGAICNLAYNVGVDGVQEFVQMIAALRIKDYARASAELGRSKWAREVQKSRVDRLTLQLQSGLITV